MPLWQRLTSSPLGSAAQAGEAVFSSRDHHRTTMLSRLELPQLAHPHSPPPDHSRLTDAPRLLACVELHRRRQRAGTGGSAASGAAAAAAAAGASTHHAPPQLHFVACPASGQPVAYVIAEEANHAGPRFGLVALREEEQVGAGKKQTAAERWLAPPRRPPPSVLDPAQCARLLHSAAPRPAADMHTIRARDNAPPTAGAARCGAGARSNCGAAAHQPTLLWTTRGETFKLHTHVSLFTTGLAPAAVASVWAACSWPQRSKRPLSNSALVISLVNRRLQCKLLTRCCRRPATRATTTTPACSTCWGAPLTALYCSGGSPMSRGWVLRASDWTACGLRTRLLSTRCGERVCLLVQRQICS